MVKLADTIRLRRIGETRTGSNPVASTITIYGPYFRKDGRAHVILYDTINLTRQTQSYPRFLVEKNIGRKLSNNEEIDHIDGDKTNNAILNLQILTKAENVSKSFVDGGRSAIYTEYECYVCKKKIIRYAKDVERARKNGRNSPCCSKRCSGLSDK